MTVERIDDNRGRLHVTQSNISNGCRQTTYVAISHVRQEGVVNGGDISLPYRRMLWI